VRSCIDLLIEILTVFRKTGNHSINTRCIDLVIYLAYAGMVGRILAPWLIHACMADNGTVAYLFIYLFIIVLWAKDRAALFITYLMDLEVTTI